MSAFLQGINHLPNLFDAISVERATTRNLGDETLANSQIYKEVNCVTGSKIVHYKEFYDKLETHREGLQARPWQSFIY